MDSLVANVLWATLLGMALGAMLGVLIAAAGKKRRDGAASRAYLTSFQYVLSDDPDAAVEELTRIAAVTPETMETYFALGALFRRKGDLTRAARIHQNIILRPGLDANVKRRAAYELALDYRRAGLLGRAIEALGRVVAEDPSHRDAHRDLRDLYADTGEWENAIAAQGRLAALGAPSPSILAHLHAARARALLAEHELDAAAASAEAAHLADGSSSDARVAQGEVLLAKGDSEAAIAAFSTALRSDPGLLSVVFPRLEEAFARQSAWAGLGVFLGERLREAPDDPLVRLALARHLRARALTAEATQELRRLLEKHPRFLPARQELAAILLAEGTADELKAQLSALLENPPEPVRPFRCRRCQLDLAEHSFRCPRCSSWDSVGRADESRAQVAEAG